MMGKNCCLMACKLMQERVGKTMEICDWSMGTVGISDWLIGTTLPEEFHSAYTTL